MASQTIIGNNGTLHFPILTFSWEWISLFSWFKIAITSASLICRYGYCWVVDRAGSPPWTNEFWELFQLSVIWLSSIAIIILMVMIWRKTQEVVGLEGCSPYIQKALKKLSVYPFILVFCYLLVSYKNVSDIRYPHRRNYTEFFGNGADLMLCLQVREKLERWNTPALFIIMFYTHVLFFLSYETRDFSLLLLFGLEIDQLRAYGMTIALVTICVAVFVACRGLLIVATIAW